MLGGEQGFEQVVGEAQAQDVEDRALAQEVVDAVDVFLRDQADQRPVQFLRGFLVGAKGFFHDQQRGLGKLPGLQHLAGPLAHCRGEGEVEGHRALKGLHQLGQFAGFCDVEFGEAGVRGDLVEFDTARGRGLLLCCRADLVDALLPFLL